MATKGEQPGPACARGSSREAMAAWETTGPSAYRAGCPAVTRLDGAHRAGLGWRAHHLLLDDGAAVLALGRPWRCSAAVASTCEGPVTAGGAGASGCRAPLRGGGWAGAAGYDAILADAEIPAATATPRSWGPRVPSGGGGGAVAPPGRRPPSRRAPATTCSSGIAKTTRQRFLARSAAGCWIVRHRHRGGRPARAGLETPAPEPADLYLPLLL